MIDCSMRLLVAFIEMNGWDGIHSQFNWQQICKYEKIYDKIYLHT